MSAIHRSSVQLFHELKSKYPEVPDDVVNTCIQQNGNDREKCMQALQSDSPRYLFGGRLPNEQTPRRLQDVHGTRDEQGGRKLQEVHITREDSSSSLSGGNQQHQYISRSRDTGANIHTSESWSSDLSNNVSFDNQGRQSPSTTPVMAHDFSAFMPQNATKSPRQIPNINCTTYGGTDSSGTASPQSTGSPSEGRRAVKVLHYPSRPSTTPPVSSVGISNIPNQQQYVYRIQFGADSGGMCTVSPQSSSLQNLHQSLPAVSQPGQYSPEVSSGPQSYTSSPGQMSNQYKHSSQATIFINKNTNNGQISPDRPSNIRTNNYSPFSPDPRMGVQPLPISLAGQTPPVSSYGAQQIPHGYNQPLSVTIRASGPAPGFTLSGAHSPTRYGVSALSSNQLRGQYPSATQPPFHMQQTHNQTPIVNTTSSAFITPALPRFPSQASSITTHAIPVIGSQTSSEHGNIVLQETDTGRHMPYPTMSPSSSQSSLSSESSRSDAYQRQRSGSLQEEMAYTQALLSHQHSRMERLKCDFDQECNKLEKLRAEVSQMEKNMFERSRLRKNCFPGVEDVTKMRQANRKLQTDIQVMVNEIDMYKNGQVPFSVIDPHGQQNFYKNIPTGQRMERNSIHANQPANQSRSSESPPPPVPPRNLNCVPPAPPSQPPAGSGDSEEGEQWSCSACTFLNHPALNKCECCEMPRVTTGS